MASPSSTLSVTQFVVARALHFLTPPGSLLSVIKNKYGDEYAKDGMKVGDTIQVPKPLRLSATSGIEYNPQGVIEQTVPLTVGINTQVPWELGQFDQFLRYQDRPAKDFSGNSVFKKDVDTIAQAASLAMMSEITEDIAIFMAQNAGWGIGTPGVASTTGINFLTARSVLNEQGLAQQAPSYVLMSSQQHANLVNGTISQFNPAAAISQSYETGMAPTSMVYGSRFMAEELLYTHTVGNYGGVPLVNNAQTGTGGWNGTMSLVTDGWTPTTSTLEVGDRFTISGVFATVPNSTASTGRLLQFTVQQQAVADGAGNKTIVVSPAITPTGPYQNATAGAANNAPITVIGTANAVSRCGLVISPDALLMASVPLTIPSGVNTGGGMKSTAMRSPKSNLAISLTTGGNFTDLSFPNRMDCLYGRNMGYRELCVVVYS